MEGESSADGQESSADGQPVGEASSGRHSTSGQRLVIQRVADGPHTRVQRGEERRKRRRRRRLIGRIMLGGGVLLLLAMGWIGFRAYQCYSNLSDARAELATLKANLKSVTSGEVDLAAVRADLVKIKDATSSAAGAGRDPLLTAATIVPWLGDNLDALRQAAIGSDEVITAGQNLVGLAAATPSDTLMTDGRLNVEALQRLGVGAADLAVAVDSADDRINSLNFPRLVGPAVAAVGDLRTTLGDIRPVVDQIGGWGKILPALLGSGGQRDYLVVFQNLAETRASGGIFGSYAVLRVADGGLSIVDQGATDRKFAQFDPPVEGSDDQVYGALPRTFAQDVNLSADFPTSAKLISTMYTKATGGKVDGVLSLDPVALSYLLAGHPPIKAGDTTLTAENLVKTLLVDNYARYPSGLDIDKRDAATGAALIAAFQSVTNKPADLGAWVKALHRSAQESRILFWSADPAEQQVVGDGGLGGGLNQRIGPDTGGLYLNDSAGTKLEYYLNASSTISTSGCGAGRVGRMVTILRNNAPEKLPPYVLGVGVGKDRVIRLDLAAYAPSGGQITGVSVDGKPVGQAMLNTPVGPASFFTVQVPPGKQISVQVDLALPPSGSLAELNATPLVSPWPVKVEAAPECAS